MLDSSFFDFDWENELPIPWNLHGDGAPFTEVDSLKVVSMRCPLSSLDVEHSQLMLAAVPKQATVTTTWAPLWQALADSFEILAQGKNTRRGIALSIVGDLEFFCQEFGFPTAMSNQCCPFCMATNFHGENPCPFTDMRPACLLGNCNSIFDWKVSGFSVVSWVGLDSPGPLHTCWRGPYLPGAVQSGERQRKNQRSPTL